MLFQWRHSHYQFFCSFIPLHRHIKCQWPFLWSRGAADEFICSDILARLAFLCVCTFMVILNPPELNAIHLDENQPHRNMKIHPMLSQWCHSHQFLNWWKLTLVEQSVGWKLTAQNRRWEWRQWRSTGCVFIRKCEWVLKMCTEVADKGPQPQTFRKPSSSEVAAIRPIYGHINMGNVPLSGQLVRAACFSVHFYASVSADTLPHLHFYAFSAVQQHTHTKKRG